MLSSAGSAEWLSIPNALDTTSYWANKGNRKLHFMISIMICCEFLCGFDGTIIGNLQALPAWQNDLGHPKGARLGLLNAISSVTGALVGPFNAYICDRFGRRWPIRFYGFTMCLGTLIGVLAGIKTGTTSFALFLVSKAIIGVGMQCGLVTSMITLQEISHPRHRAVSTAIFDPQFCLGSAFASFITFGTSYISSSWSWRIPYLIQLVPACYVLFATFLIPESPRFLVSKGREQEALDFLIEYHGNGNPDDELVKFEFEEIKATLALEQEAASQSWRSVWNGPGNKKRFFLAGLMTFIPQLNGGSIISFYYTQMLALVGVTAAGTQLGINTGLLVWQFLIMIVACVYMNRMRRRWVTLFTWPIMTAALAGLMACTAVYEKSGGSNRAASIATIAMVWVFQGVSSVSGPLFYSYPAEVLNYTTRAKGMAVWSVVNQCCGIFSSFVNSIGLDNVGYKYYGFYIALLPMQWVLMYFFMVETKGYTLEEIAIQFEGDHAPVVVAQVTVAGGADSDSEKKMEF